MRNALRYKRIWIAVLLIAALLSGCGQAHPAPSPSPAPTPTPEPTPSPAPTEPPAPTRLDDSFFDDAAFLGNSLMDGLRLFGGLQYGDFYSGTSASVVSVTSPTVCGLQPDTTGSPELTSASAKPAT